MFEMIKTKGTLALCAAALCALPLAGCAATAGAEEAVDAAGVTAVEAVAEQEAAEAQPADAADVAAGSLFESQVVEVIEVDGVKTAIGADGEVVPLFESLVTIGAQSSPEVIPEGAME